LNNPHPDSKIESKGIFDSLNASSQFMAMAINRSQDYMKASSNIALAPAMETFELQSALMMPLTCMRHLMKDRLIVVHPLASHMCSNLISDKHWISENVLCLLSNAVKYSNDGTVDLRITIVNNSTKWCNSRQSSMVQMVHVSVEDTGKSGSGLISFIISCTHHLDSHIKSCSACNISSKLN
jgi:signal transduction histidine kinase